MKTPNKLYRSLYGEKQDKESNNRRITDLYNNFRGSFKDECTALFSASGRTELGGNHTDHNNGKVLAGSINLDTLAAVRTRDDLTVRLISEGYGEIAVDLSDLSVRDSEKNTTASLIRGIAASFHDRGLEIGGFNASLTSTVLPGSGLSSSASIEVLLAEIFNNLFNGDRLDPVQLAIIGREAENRYFKKPCGLLDQMACAYGGIIGMDFKEEIPLVTPIDVSFEDYGLSLVIVNTKGSHADLTDEYSAIPREMKQVAAYFGKSVLREVDYDEFIASIKDLREKLDNDRAILRAMHFFNENLRVDGMIDALKSRDIQMYLALVDDSGSSSFRFLQNVYPSSSPAFQGLSLALSLSEEILSGDGACRVHGGGFAGTIQAYVPQDMLQSYIERMEAVFGEGACTVLSIRKKPAMRLV